MSEPAAGADARPGPAISPPISRQWWLILLVAVWALVGGFILTDIPRTFPNPDVLDFCYQSIITHASENGWQWGKQIVYNYGPLGYVHYPVFTLGSWWKSLVYQVLHAALYLYLLWRVTLSLPQIALRGVILVSGVIFVGFMPDSVQILLGWMTALLLASDKRQDRVAGWLGLVAIILGAHIKMTFLFHGVALVVLLGAEHLAARRWRSACLPALVFLTGFLAFWGLLGQDYANLGDYLYYGWELARGHNETMGIAAPLRYYLLAPPLCLATVWVVVWPLTRAGGWRRQWGMALFMLATLFLAWKQALTRGDEGHVHTLLGVAIPMLLIGIGRLPFRVQTGRDWKVGLAAASAALLFAVLWQYPFHRLYTSSTDKISFLRYAQGSPARVQAAFTQLMRRFDLPEIRRVVGDRTVDIMGSHENIPLLLGMNYRPAPAFQSYIAYTPALIRLNTRHYLSDAAPDYVIFRISFRDQRKTTSNNALILLELLKNYTPVLRERDMVLFQRTPRGPVEKTLVAQGEFKIGDVVPLPGIQGPLWCELESEETFFGKLFKQALYRPVLHTEFTVLPTRFTHTFNIVPSMSSEGFIISPLMLQTPDLIASYDPEVQSNPMLIRHLPGPASRWLMKPSVTYKFYSLNLALSPTQDADALAHIRRLRLQWMAEDQAR